MAKKKDNAIIEIMHPICCGLDVHKEGISACLISVDSDGKDQVEIREFSAFTKGLIELRNWLVFNQCPIVAMESTGIYWRPVHNIVEADVEVILVNARHVKNVPGRKTDISDCKWLAGLLRHGLLKGSFIPEKQVRQWRELETIRKSHVKTIGDYKRRVHKLFETANIKIDSVVSDLFGVTGRNLMNLLCNEEAVINTENIEKCARGSLKSKVEELHDSLEGFFEDHHRFQLKGMLRIISELEKESESVTQRLKQLMEPYNELLERLDEIPGVNEISARSILSHVGTTLKEFGSAAQMSSWAGLCPGNNESAGKRKDGRSPVHSHPFRTVLTEIAWSAIKKNGSYYKDKYYRLRSRLGPKKAIIAIAHRICKAIYHIIKDGQSYKELGEDYLLKKNKAKKLSNLKKQARKMGFELVAAQA
jgi:transposase